MSLPVPYIQNYSIEFSRISGYYTKGGKNTHTQKTCEAIWSFPNFSSQD